MEVRFRDRIAMLNNKVSPTTIIVLGFALVILIGGTILSMPFSTIRGESIGFTDALFTATSAVCVTGLNVVDTNTTYNTFGKIIIMILIQVGGLGIMSLYTLFAMLTGRRLGLKDRLTIQESISNFNLKGVYNTFRDIMFITFAIEGVGAVLFATQLIPRYGLVVGTGKSIFQAVSAFCNAGFDLFGKPGAIFVSLTNYNDNYLMLLTTAFLIIIGGLGFIVWNDVYFNKRFSSLTLHTKLVLIMTGILLVSGTAAFYFLEKGNGTTMGNMGTAQQMLNAFFHSVTCRTAGFNSLPIDKLHDSSNFISVILMFIGAAPGSTGGGVKVTTISVILLAVYSFSRGEDTVQVFHNRIPNSVIIKSISIVVLSFTVTAITTIIILNTTPGTRFLQAIYEATSAFGTVGLTMGITPGLSFISKYAVIGTMFLGRVGPLTAMIVFVSLQKKRKANWKYAEGKIVVG